MNCLRQFYREKSRLFWVHWQLVRKIVSLNESNVDSISNFDAHMIEIKTHTDLNALD